MHNDYLFHSIGCLNATLATERKQNRIHHPICIKCSTSVIVVTVEGVNTRLATRRVQFVKRRLWTNLRHTVMPGRTPQHKRWSMTYIRPNDAALSPPECCQKSAVGKTGSCVGHGGGRRCQTEGCTKSARSSSASATPLTATSSCRSTSRTSGNSCNSSSSNSSTCCSSTSSTRC